MEHYVLVQLHQELLQPGEFTRLNEQHWANEMLTYYFSKSHKSNNTSWRTMGCNERSFRTVSKAGIASESCIWPKANAASCASRFEVSLVAEVRIVYIKHCSFYSARFHKKHMAIAFRWRKMWTNYVIVSKPQTG